MAGGFSNFEQNILDNIESNTGESFDDVDTGTDSGEVDESQQSLESQTKPRTVRDEAGDNLTDPLLNKQPGKPVKETKTVQSKDPNQRVDAKGNIVDAQGKVIATDGYARRVHAQNERLREQTQGLRTQNSDLVRQLQEAKSLDGLPREYGLENQEVKDGLAIVAAFKKDPATAARSVIERALAAGVSLHQIINDEFIPNVTLDATRRMIEDRLPLQPKPQQGVDDVDARAVEKTQQFLVDYPEAELHSGAVATVMKQLNDEYVSKGVTNVDPYLIAERAWDKVQQFCDRFQLDINEPLGPQIQAKREEQQAAANGNGNNANGNRNGNPVRQSRPMARSSNGGGVVERKSQAAPADDSFDSIVRSSLQENGYQL